MFLIGGKTTTMRQINCSLFLYAFIITAIILVPFTFFLSPFDSSIGQVLFSDIINWIWNSYSNQEIVTAITSDSIGMYVLFIIIIFMSLILSFIILKLTRVQFQTNFIKFVKAISTIYLSLILFKYGCDKIFHAQFYTPEPNILYTNFGKLDQDILYWSVMGLSWKYSLFLGVTEVFIAIGLLFQKTRVLSLFISLFTFVHIVVINFSFDISVKLFSSFLLIINVALVYPFLKRTILFMAGKGVNQLSVYKIMPQFFHPRTKVTLSISILFLIVSEGLASHISTYNYTLTNNDQYKVQGAFSINEKHEILERNELKRIYFHKDNYIIFHFKDDSQLDFYYEWDNETNSLILFDYEKKAFRIELIKHNSKELELNLKGLFGLRKLWLTRIDHKMLPALQEQFHWSIEDIQ
ncbi:MAG: hypothetical protein COA32_06290 [Fluviicola sp.]|nr:MAG: hypothetical protein COA32_06290 [Fluviicola sp.]